MKGGKVRVLARGVKRMGDAVAGADRTGVKNYVSEHWAVAADETRLMEAAKGAARGGPVNLVLMHPELPGEVEIPLPSKYPITPQIKGAIKHVAGVAHVEDF